MISAFRCVDDSPRYPMTLAPLVGSPLHRALRLAILPAAFGLGTACTPPPPAAPVEPPAAAEPTPPPEPSIPKGTTVLHIGDSFAGALGVELDHDFEEHEIKSVLKFKASTYISTWAKGPKLGYTLHSLEPDLVLITLGANDLDVPDPAWRVKSIERIVAKLEDIPCVWVGIPLWKDARPDLLETIREHCAPCVYMDTNALLPDMPRTPDGIHPAYDTRKAWADFVFHWLLEHRHPTPEHPWAIAPG